MSRTTQKKRNAPKRRVASSRQAAGKRLPPPVTVQGPNVAGAVAAHPSSANGTTLVRQTVSGHEVWRQESAKNQYNAEGISLAAIDRELLAAFLPHDLISRLSLAELKPRYFRFQGMPPLVGRVSATLIPFGFATQLADPQDKAFEDYVHDCLLPDRLIQPDDEALADDMKACPMVLALSDIHQVAYGRWAYAARHPLQQVRAKGKALLQRFQSRPVGPPVKRPLRLPEFLQAYEDLRAYVNCWYGCIRAERARVKIMGFFADCAKMEPALQRVRRRARTLNEVLSPAINGPSASDVAVEYISQFAGLKRSRIHDFIAEARHSQR